MKRLVLLWLVVLVGCGGIMAQQVQGVIYRKGKPRKGVVVWLKKSYANAETDKNGHFILDCEYPDDTLMVTVTNHQDARVPIDGASALDIFLDKKSFTLRSGDVEKELEYTAVTNTAGGGMNHEWIMRSGLHSVSDLLKYVSGVEVVSNNMSGSASIRIRGINSINSSNEPLLVVDGIPSDIGSVDSVVPVETIQKIEVHKDGSAWGVRGANGVIEIITIQGET